MNTIFAILVCFLCMGSQTAHTRYLEQPWRDPCGGSNVVPGTGGQGGTDGTVNVNDALNRIVASAAESQSFARLLRMKYNNESDPKIRITTRTAGSLQTRHFMNFPDVRAHSSNVGVALQRDYDDVSTIIVFMENVHLNERTSQTTVKYTHEMDDLETSLYHTLCKIKMAADAINQSLDVNITYDVMDSSYRNPSHDPSRYMRDFIVFRDSESFLEGFSHGY